MTSSHNRRRNGLGERRRLADGRIRVTVCHGTDIRGRKRRVSAVAETEADADRVAMELAASLGMRPDLGNGLTLRRWWDAYAAGRGNRLANATFKRYRRDMDKVWLPELGGTDISLITRADVQRVLLTLPSRPTAAHAKATLSAVLTQAVRDGHLKENQIRQGGYELPGDVGCADWDSTDYESDPFGAIEGTAGVWDARTVLRAASILRGNPIEPCFLAMVGAGLRKEEALALHWRDVRRIEVGGRMVTQLAVHHALTAEDGFKRTKTRRSVRIVAMVEPFGVRLWGLRGERDEWVCTLGEGNVHHRWADMWKPCPSKHARRKDRRRGIMVDIDEPVPWLPLHRLRATHATYLQQAGVADSVNAAAHGHSERVSYGHYQRADDVDAARRGSRFMVVSGGQRYAKAGVGNGRK